LNSHELLGQLLDQLQALGETAQHLKQALASNGHKVEELEETKELLPHEASK
jgi:prefoldin subunit 5